MIYPTITEFINRVQRAQGTKSKEFRITIEEATKLSLELNKLIMTKAIMFEKPEPTNRIDGGTFR